MNQQVYSHINSLTAVQLYTYVTGKFFETFYSQDVHIKGGRASDEVEVQIK